MVQVGHGTVAQSQCPHSLRDVPACLRRLRAGPLSNHQVNEGFLADVLSPLHTLSLSLHFYRHCLRELPTVHSVEYGVTRGSSEALNKTVNIWKDKWKQLHEKSLHVSINTYLTGDS